MAANRAGYPVRYPAREDKPTFLAGSYRNPQCTPGERLWFVKTSSA